MKSRLLTTILAALAFAGILRPQVPVIVDSPGFREFTNRVNDYLTMQKAVPRIRNTKQRKEIDDRREALAQKIRETRATAKPGDIFTPAGTEEFRKVIRSAFQGTGAPNIRKTIRQGEPLQGWHLTLNASYPEHFPMTTVPPTLLRRLPQLPSSVAYRIIGHDFVLQDTEARVVIDFITGIIP